MSTRYMLLRISKRISERTPSEIMIESVGAMPIPKPFSSCPGSWLIDGLVYGFAEVPTALVAFLHPRGCPEVWCPRGITG